MKMKYEHSIERRAESEEQRAKKVAVISDQLQCTVAVEKSETSVYKRMRFPARKWSGGLTSFGMTAYGSSPLVKGVSVSRRKGDAFRMQFKPSRFEKPLKVSGTSSQLTAHSSSFTLCPVYTGHLPQGRISGESRFTANSLWLEACSLNFTLCSRKWDHLPQGRTSEDFGSFALSSKHSAISCIKRNSTVNNNSKFPQRRACPSDLFRRDCIYKTSLPVSPKRGSELGELAFRACEFLLN